MLAFREVARPLFVVTVVIVLWVAGSTRIGTSGDTAVRFVSGPSELVRYNSRLPLVVMVPAGCEVQWRVWSAGRGFANATDRPSKNTQ